MGFLPVTAIDITIYYLRKLAIKKDWQKLSYGQQKALKDKAAYLIDCGYVYGKTVEELAKEIYEKVIDFRLESV